MRPRLFIVICATVALAASLGCNRAKNGNASREYDVAMARYQQVMNEVSTDHTNPAFDEVLQLLAQVPQDQEPQHTVAKSLIGQIEKDRKEARAFREEADQRLRDATKVPSRSRGSSYSGYVGILPPAETPAPAAAPSRTEAFNQAAEEARRRRMEEAQKQQMEAAAARKDAETKAKMQQRVDEKLKKSEWKCNYVTGNCQREATVTEDEVK